MAFSETVQALNKNFWPKLNRVYLVHRLRQLKKELGGTFEGFMLDCNKGPKVCGFTDDNIEIKSPNN